MDLIKCPLAANACYKAGQALTPKGVMVHSTGADNPMLRRYVQPLPGEADYDGLMDLLGKNPNGNHWNRAGTNACVHAFVGKLADGSVAAVQTLPWTMRGWHAGTGTSGKSANDTHISFEICEDDLTDPDYFAQVYRAAVELTAYLCKEYGLDPLADGVVICHSEGYRRGVASGHADVEHWFPRHGKSMDDFRADVAKEMDNDMDQEKFDAMMADWLSRRDAMAPSGWSEEARKWAEEAGLIQGDGKGNMTYKSFCTREEMVAFLHRLADLLTSK